MIDVVLATGRELAHPDVETPLLVEALAARGLDAAIAPWGTPAAGDGRLVVVRTTWDYTAHLPEFLTWAGEVAARSVLLNPLDVIAWNSHKSYLLDLAYAGVPMIPTALVARHAGAAEQYSALEEYTGEVVIKPAVSVGAIGALRAPARSPQAAEHLATMVASGDMLVQPFEPTVTDGEVSLLYFGGRFSHAVRKTPAAGDYRVQVMYGGTVEPHLPSDDELAVGAAALAAVTGDLAYARVDVLATPRGPAVMELELIEPQLFLDLDAAAPVRLASHLAARLAG